MEQPHHLPHSSAWRALLEQQQSVDDTPLVCKLLCVSKSMAALVHSTCSGRLSVVIKQRIGSSRQDAQSQQPNSWPDRLAPARWLAKHLLLLHSFSYQGVVNSADVEGALAAAFAAAAAATSAGRAAATGRTTTRQAAAAAAPFAAVTAAAADSPACTNTRHRVTPPLPLRRLTFEPVVDGRLLCSLAAVGTQLQLTYMSLGLSDRGEPAAGAKAALASLTSLRELRFHPAFDIPFAPMLTVLLPALSKLQALTYLDTQDFFLSNGKVLPTSLRHC